MEKKKENQLASELRKLRDKFIRKIGKMFLRKQYFFGRYSDCLMDAKKFAKTNNVMIQMMFHKDMKFYPVGESDDRKSAMKELIVEEQRKEIKKRLRKEKEMVVYFVEDNQITRALGWVKTPTHYFLAV
jgi:hypothetical protein